MGNVVEQLKKTNSAHVDKSSSDLLLYVYPTSQYRTVFQSLVIGTFALVGIISMLLFVSYFTFHHTQVIGRIVLCAISLLYLAITYWVWTKGKLVFASRLLIGFYFFIATFVIAGGGLNTPFGLLVFAIGIILAGILLGAKHVLYAAGITVVLIMAIQTYITIHGSPLSSSASNVSHFGDATAYSALLLVLALISWLFGRRTEHLFLKNKQAEQALLKEKELLEARVEERTRQLRQAQLDEMEQLYRFAEVGQLSAALLHDLANHLSVLNFDIADLKKNRRSQAVEHVEESVSYLDQFIHQVRKQLQGKSESTPFDLADTLQDNLKIVEGRAAEAHVHMRFIEPSKPITLYGDPLRLSHVINILVQNAIEAYGASTNTTKRLVEVMVSEDKASTSVHVIDHGKGIDASARKHLFTPLRTTKKDGLGIGLFIAKKIIETHFKGTLELSSTTKHTEFIVRIPKITQ